MKLRFPIILVVLFLVGCVPGTVDYDDSGGWTTNGSPSVDNADNPQSDTNDDTDDDSPSVEDPPGDEIPDDTPDEPMCPSGQDMCADVCVDLVNDSSHCGACENVCPGGSACTASKCVCDAAGEELCGDTCVDTTSSTQHCGGCDQPCGGGMICSSGQCSPSVEVAGVLAETNAAREAGADCGAYGIKDPAPPLEGDPDLHEAAQVHAEDMAANNFFDHTGSDGSSFSDRIRRTDFVGAPVGENIAAGYGSPAAVVAGWIDSDGHCRNLMNPSATKIGIGYTTGGPYGTLWVQVFGR